MCGGILAWNMALSTRRQYYSGKLIKIQKTDLSLKVNCPGKIEPKVQQTIQALIDGPKKAVYVKEGDPVKTGQLLMEIGDDNIKVEVSNKRVAAHNAEEEYQKQKKEVELSKRLYRHMAIPKRDLENAQEALERAGQVLDNAKRDLSSAVKKAEGVRIVSPLTGVVLKILVAGENTIPAGKDLMKIAKMDKFVVEGKVDELDLSQIALGQEAVINCQAFAGTLMRGKVSWIGAQAGDSSFADIPVTLDIVDLKGLALKPNINAEGKIIVGQIPQAIVIPAGALRKNSAGAFVLKANRAGWLKNQPVDIKRLNADQIQVLKGLQEGNSVLVPPEEQ